MATWDRRLSAASGKPAMGGQGRTSRTALLGEAISAGVVEDDQKALMAMANIARDRPGFHKTLEVRAHVDDELIELVFDILHTDEGPLVRLSDGVGAPAAVPSSATPGEGDGGEQDEEGLDIVSILTDTLVETPDPVAVFASVGHEAVWANDAFVTVVPIRETDKVWLVELLDEWSKGHYEVKVLPALVKYGRWRGRLTMISGEDETLPVSAVIVAHRDRQGEIEAVSLVARDLGEAPVQELVDELGDSPFAALVERSTDIIAVLDTDGSIKYASPAAARAAGWQSGQELVGVNALELLHPEDRPSDLTGYIRSDEQGIGTPVEIRLQTADGKVRFLEAVVSDLRENPAIGGIVVNARDVTDRIAGARAIADRALRDELTELPGRLRLLDHLSGALSEAPAGSVAVLHLDLDRIRNVNELLGRDAGDELIRIAADRLRDVLGETFLARLGGDEFVVVRTDSSKADAQALARSLRETLAVPMELAGGPFDITASVGIALSVGDDDPELLLRNADKAVAEAKAGGRDRIDVFTDELSEAVTRRRSAEQTLRRALDQDGIKVHYQPIVELPSREVVAAEALLRVREEGGDLLSPAEFIEAAESSGLIARLGGQVLETTCAQLAEWTGRSHGIPGEITVNVSPRQLADPSLPTRVVEALSEADVTPERLSLEITESILIGAQPTIDASISYLRALGVKIGLDDFGAGVSSLSYFRRFPLDFVKIDRSLVAGVGVDEQDMAIVRATVELAHNLGLEVVAVGVETEEQLEYLELLGCDRAQGYFFSGPKPAADFGS